MDQIVNLFLRYIDSPIENYRDFAPMMTISLFSYFEIVIMLAGIATIRHERYIECLFSKNFEIMYMKNITV
eukprot:scaffold5376_cov171-Amphora_coffeaeformis.AAC.2